MQENYNGNYSFDETDENQDSSPRIAIWAWPVLGSVAIGIIVVTLLQTPWLQAKLGFGETPQAQEAEKVAALAPEKPAIKKPAAPDKPVAKVVAVNAKPEKKSLTMPEKPAASEAKATISDVAALRIEMTRIGDMLAAIDKSIKEQNGRIIKLEKAVGTVTGSISPPVRGGGSSTRAKTVIIKPETAVNTAAKTDLPTKDKAAAKPKKPVNTRSARAVLHQDTGDARPAPTMAKPAMAKEAALSGDKKQFALILARAQKKSTLSAAWEKLIRGKAGELSVLEPRVRGLVTKRGNQVYDLLAGPFAHMADAIELCARLKLEGIKCKQTSYGGEPL